MPRPLLALIALLMVGCGSDPRPNPYTGASGGSGEPDGAPQQTGGAGGGGGEADGGPDSSGPDDFPSGVPPFHVAECEPLSSASHGVLTGGAKTPAFDRLGDVDGRWFAHSRDSRTLISFDEDGDDVSDVDDVIAAASDGDRLHTLLRIGPKLVVIQKFDADLDSIGKSQPTFANVDQGVALAATSAATLVLWSAHGTIEGRWISGPSYESIELGASGTGDCQLEARADDAGFGMVEACRGSNTTSVRWMRISNGGELGEWTTVVVADAAIELADVLPIDDGAMALFQQPSAKKAFLLRWDPNGNLAAAPIALSGVAKAHSLARSGDRIAIAIQQLDDTSAVVTADLDGRPSTEAARCLDENSPGGKVALASADDGFAALVRRKNGSVRLVAVP